MSLKSSRGGGERQSRGGTIRRLALGFMASNRDAEFRTVGLDATATPKPQWNSGGSLGVLSREEGESRPWRSKPTEPIDSIDIQSVDFPLTWPRRYAILPSPLGPPWSFGVFRVSKAGGVYLPGDRNWAGRLHKCSRGELRSPSPTVACASIPLRPRGERHQGGMLAWNGGRSRYRRGTDQPIAFHISGSTRS